MPELYIGLMSGTSTDGIDACLIDFSDQQCQLIDFFYQPFSSSLKSQIIRISKADHPVFLHELGGLDTALGTLFASAVNSLLSQKKVNTESILAIGSHGLTVHHAPDSTQPFSLQIGDPNIIAETTGITTIADFRRRDIAANGQGAPLVPAFHRYIANFKQPELKNICLVNIGGIANVTLLKGDQTLGFDTGPGNTLMDYWIHKQLGIDFDNHGEWAKSGKVSEPLLKQLMQDQFFCKPPPKSTGKEHFSPAWLEGHLRQSNLLLQDVQATLCQFTADTIAAAINTFAPETEATYVCGGGSHNHYLLAMLQQKLPHPATTSNDLGLHPDHVEAAAFAWLARQTLNNRPGNLYRATGASHPVILGGIYPGKNGLPWLDRER